MWASIVAVPWPPVHFSRPPGHLATGHWPRDLSKKMGTRRLASAISTAVSRPYLASIPRQLCRTIFKLWRPDLTFWGVDGGGSLWRDVLRKAHLFARLSPVEWGNVLPPLEDLSILTSGRPQVHPTARAPPGFSPGRKKRGAQAAMERCARLPSAI